MAPHGSAAEMSQGQEPGVPRRNQDSDPKEERRRRLAVLHTLAEQARQAPTVVAPKPEATPPQRRATRLRRMPTSWRGSRRRRRRRTRLWRLSLVLVAVLLLVGGSVTVALRTLRPGTPAQTTERPVTAVSALYFDPDAPWTTVMVDNRSVPIGKPGEQAPYVLTAGRHIISWEAAPFPTQQCVISSPAQRTDTCAAAYEGISYVPGEPAAQVMRLEEEADDLPAPSYGALAFSIQAALTVLEQASPIHRGDPVLLVGPVGPGVADGSYTATTRIQLETQGSSPICQLDLLSAASDCGLLSNACLPLCSLDYGERQSLGAALPAGQWLSIAAVGLLRDYESSDGEPEYAFPVSFDAQALLVGLRWQGGRWQVQAYLGTHLLAPSISDAEERILVDPACATAEMYFAEDLTSTERGAYSQVRFVSGANLSAGCLIQATAAADGEQVEYFERLGVLLALNMAAHRLHPTMPVAGAYVRQLAGQLASQPTPALAMRFPTQ